MGLEIAEAFDCCCCCFVCLVVVTVLHAMCPYFTTFSIIEVACDLTLNLSIQRKFVYQCIYLMAQINCRYSRNDMPIAYINTKPTFYILSAINSIISYLLFINTNTWANLGCQSLLLFLFYFPPLRPNSDGYTNNNKQRYLFVVSRKLRCMNFVLKLMWLVV